MSKVLRWTSAVTIVPGLGLCVVVGAALLLAGCGDGNDQSIQQANLVSDVIGAAGVIDMHLVNAWGIAASASGPFWVVDNGTGVSTLYDGNGTPQPSPTPLVVTIPPPPGSAPDATSAPTGIIFNNTTDFVITKGENSAAAVFVFATEDGTLAAWNQTVDPTNALLTVDNSAEDAVYKGLALVSSATGKFLFATNFAAGSVDVFDKTFTPTTTAGGFTDAGLPAGFAPFGIQNINGQLYVTYAKKEEGGDDDVAGPGNGFVDVFDANGNLLRRLVSGGPLNSPWGLTVAPSNFGALSGALLVGNFGDGRINGFDLSTGRSLGPLTGDGGQAIVIPGLWGLIVGNGHRGAAADAVYFTAGPSDESHGLFGSLRLQ